MRFPDWRITEIAAKREINRRMARLIFAGLFLLSGCQNSESETETSIIINPSPGVGGGNYNWISPEMIKFQDEVKSGELPTTDLLDLKFTNLENQTVALKSLLQPGRKLILVVMRGFSGEVCKFCTTQTSRLISNYSKFTDRETEIVIVYPVSSASDSSRLQELQAAAAAQLQVPNLQIPMPMLLDVNLEVVKQLGIQKNLAKPSTYIFDSEGKVRFAYVGSHLADRPSVQALLDEIDKLQ